MTTTNATSAAGLTANLSSITTTAQAKAAQAAASAQAGQAMGKDAFLKLFTTQLKNQNPLDPMNNEAFVSQLAQFSQLEATTNMSDSLNQLVNTLKGSSLTTSAALIGHQVAVPGAPAVLSGGNPVSAVLDLPSGADSVVVTVNGPDGTKVRTLTLSSQPVGLANVTWDGRDDKGDALPNGNYTMTAMVKNAGQQTNGKIGPLTTVKSVSTSSSSSDPVLGVDGGANVNFSSIMQVAY